LLLLGVLCGFIAYKNEICQTKATTAKSKNTVENFATLKQQFLDDIKDIVTMDEIPPELILNWDQTGIRIVPSSCWTMERQGVKRVEVVGLTAKPR
jgi:hypothetical protein